LGTQTAENTSEDMYVNVEDPDDVIPQSAYDKITISAVRNQYKKVE
jgi:hypothetical protein